MNSAPGAPNPIEFDFGHPAHGTSQIHLGAPKPRGNLFDPLSRFASFGIQKHTVTHNINFYKNSFCEVGALAPAVRKGLKRTCLLRKKTHAFH